LKNKGGADMQEAHVCGTYFHTRVVPAVLAWAAPKKIAWMEAGCSHPVWVCQAC
jgi:hypothetical protein